MVFATVCVTDSGMDEVILLLEGLIMYVDLWFQIVVNENFDDGDSDIVDKS